MLRDLSKNFEHYAIHARFKPVFVAIFPFVLTILAWCPQAKTILGGAMTLLISFGIMTFISIYISNLGNDLQDKYFEKWGGAPTTLLLLPNNGELDAYTKQRYFTWLNERCSNLNLPEEIDGMADSETLYEKIRSAVNFMREYTRDKKTYPQVYNDNVSYGFARNIVSIKYAGLLVALVSVLANCLFIYFSYVSVESASSNAMGMVAILSSILSGVVFGLVLSERFVKRRGFRYARTLFEVCDKNK